MRVYPTHSSREAGAALILLVILLPVIVAFLALAIDLFKLQTLYTEQKNSAEYAALSALSSYVNSYQLTGNHNESLSVAKEKAKQVVDSNNFFGERSSQEDNSDENETYETTIALGVYNSEFEKVDIVSDEETLEPLPEPVNSAKVTVRLRNPGSITLFFYSAVFGSIVFDTTSTAYAYYEHGLGEVDEFSLTILYPEES